MSTSARNRISPKSTKITKPTALHPPAYEVPDEPLATIPRGGSWSVLDLRELWAHRELLYFLTWRDLKVRYKQTMFGVAWVVMQPLLMTLIFTIFLGTLARVPTAGLPYPLLVFAGLVPWTFFSTGVIGCCSSLTSNANLITKVYFPRVLVPASNIAARLVDFSISFGILIVLIMFYRFVLHYRVPITWNLAALPFIIVLVTLFTFALGTLASCLNVKYRDVSVALPVAIQLWMFVSPVIYPTSLVPEKWRNLYFLNPMAGMIDGFRSALFGGKLNMFALGIAVIGTIALLICSALVFRQTEKGFADVI